MNCELCRSELEDFLYGELAEARAAAIRAHLAGCGACASARAQLERENELFARFYERTAIDPSPEMWQTISERIRTETARSRPRKNGWLASLASFSELPGLRQAAFSLLLIALTVAVTTWVLKRTKSPESGVRSPESGVRSPESGVRSLESGVRSPESGVRSRESGVRSLESGVRSPESPVLRAAPRRRPISEQGLLKVQIARAEREYQQAIKMLDSALAKREGGLDPELVRQYQSSLALIDSSIAASRRALHERPDDLATGQFLLAAYARKVELMQDFSMR